MRGRLWLQYGSSGLSTWAVHGAPHIGHGGHGRRVANLGTLGPRRGYPDPQPAAGGGPSPGVGAGAWSGTMAARGADAGLDGTDAGFLSYFSAEPSHATTRPRCILRLNIVARLAYVIPNP